MSTLRRAQERHCERHRKSEVWLTFEPEDRGDLLCDGFERLELFNESHLSPGATLAQRAKHDAEIVTYVRQGAITYQDSTGRSALIQGGEFQCTTTRRGVEHTEKNTSRADRAHVFQFWLGPAEPLAPSYEQKRFSTAQRRGVLCVVACADARGGALRLHQDTQIFSALLDPGQHLVHELLQGRSAWLHLVRGKATVGDLVLSTGDGVGLTAERAVSFTAASEDTEILLFDLSHQLPKFFKNGATHEASVRVGEASRRR